MVALLYGFYRDNTAQEAKDLAANMESKLEAFKVKILHVSAVLKSIDSIRLSPMPTVLLGALQEKNYQYLQAGSFNNEALDTTIEFHNLFANWNYEIQMEAQKDLL